MKEWRKCISIGLGVQQNGQVELLMVACDFTAFACSLTEVIEPLKHYEAEGFKTVKIKVFLLPLLLI